MSYEKVLQADDLIIGTKQTLKALDEGIVSEVIIAIDAEYRVIYKVEALAKTKNIPLVYVDSMKKLGKACGIEVSAAAVALKK
ncbi:50S ribosomal protein L7ae-like protein [Halalkalibacter oceani]|uniref:RNA-binding protein M3202_16625 n=1 Tax=Halalkalibacter oceani TaxID=1653776 RepID=A0A9X2DRC1_9BACI|nr:50S ribosomal protein L7ae-like protein [Halalkalibacter oceani]MCM3715691.1 50S ribosomal protein L7ae-like protein [Halalkalibacter oceani]MCM3762389.1 50S ribosomal protein L7ae-like protein [Halalkalibacter oceani]